MPVIQTVLFDLGGTLLHYEQPPELSFDAINARALHALLEAAAAAGVRVRDHDIAVRAVGRMAAAAEAKAKRARYASTAEVIIREGLEAVGVSLPAPAFQAGIEAYYRTVSSIVRPVDGDPANVLARLSAQGRSMGVVSNTSWAPALHDSDLERFGLLQYLPVRIYSYAFGLTKPHQAIYREALNKLDVAPLEAVFVGDRLAVDIAGARKVGMRTVLVRSPYHAEEDPEITPDETVDTIAELPELLAAWELALNPEVR